MAFLGQAPAYTNMASFDILPNAAGHEQIFKVIAKYLDEKAPLITTTPAVTEAPEIPSENTTIVATPEDTTDITDEVPVPDATDGGCGSMVVTGIIAVALLGGVIVCKKKK